MTAKWSGWRYLEARFVTILTIRFKGALVPAWPADRSPTRTGPVEADGAVDAQNAPTAPWKTLLVFHELPQGFPHQITHDKPRKSPESYWETRIDPLYPAARRLLITADGGGSNGHRLRQWKVELQRFADGTGLAIMVCHFPPGTSKWNKVEHRLFSFISTNWRGEPLRDYETIVQLIANTTTAKGLTVTCRLDRRRYPVGRKVSDKEMATLRLTPQAFHGDWNYVIKPHTKV